MNLFVLNFMGPWQIVLIVLIVLIIFGGKKIPELMRGLGQGMKEFKNATKDEKEENEIDSKKEDGKDTERKEK